MLSPSMQIHIVFAVVTETLQDSFDQSKYSLAKYCGDSTHSNLKIHFQDQQFKAFDKHIFQ